MLSALKVKRVLCTFVSGSIRGAAQPPLLLASCVQRPLHPGGRFFVAMGPAIFDWNARHTATERSFANFASRRRRPGSLTRVNASSSEHQPVSREPFSIHVRR